MIRSRRWNELTIIEKVGVIALGAIQVALFGAAQWDIRRRPASQISGSKALWTALAFINFAGPIAYFLFGRRR